MRNFIDVFFYVKRQYKKYHSCIRTYIRDHFPHQSSGLHSDEGESFSVNAVFPAYEHFFESSFPVVVSPFFVGRFFYVRGLGFRRVPMVMLRCVFLDAGMQTSVTLPLFDAPNFFITLSQFDSYMNLISNDSLAHSDFLSTRMRHLVQHTFCSFIYDHLITVSPISLTSLFKEEYRFCTHYNITSKDFYEFLKTL